MAKLVNCIIETCKNWSFVLIVPPNFSCQELAGSTSVCSSKTSPSTVVRPCVTMQKLLLRQNHNRLVYTLTLLKTQKFMASSFQETVHALRKVSENHDFDQALLLVYCSPFPRSYSFATNSQCKSRKQNGGQHSVNCSYNLKWYTEIA